MSLQSIAKADPLPLINSIRGSFASAEKVYTQGSCYRFFLILQSVFPDAEAWYEPIDGHVVTKIEGRFYDIRGERVVEPQTYLLSEEPNVEAQLKNCVYPENV